MELEVAGDPDGRVTRVVRAAAGQAGLDLTLARDTARSAWWRAGLADALERVQTAGVAPDASGADEGYEAARSPRSTRGATRA